MILLFLVQAIDTRTYLRESSDLLLKLSFVALQEWNSNVSLVPAVYLYMKWAEW